MPDPKIQDRLQQLQLEEAVAVAEDRRAKRGARENKIRAIEFSLKRDREQLQRTQAGCAHRKGGKGKDGVFNGNDASFAVITHTLSHGPTIVVCQRCGKIWEPPAKLAKRATTEQRAAYIEQMNEYRRALSLPTDNEPSGTVLFEVIRYDEEAA
jgi:hypothetical protein